MCTRRSVVAAAIDERTGELVRHGSGDPAGVLDWVRSLPQPVAVAYEAGPTGFALARMFAAAGIECVVAAMNSPPLGWATLDPRQAEPVQPNSTSCGTQPAHISLTARRHRHARHQPARRR